MEMPQILEAVQQSFRNVLKSPALALRLEDTPKEIPGWDSLAHIMLLGDIAKRLKIKFTAAEMLKMDSISKICSTVKSKLP